jgi:hypothetical protein
MAQWFYDGQIRRYVGQLIRMLSGYKYQDGTGKQIVVPVLYGDMSRQVASIMNSNSENKMPSAPRIAVYITNLQLDRSRLGDATHVSKVHIREREKVYDNTGAFLGYSGNQGAGYTVERIMPTPYKLTVKADIWSTNTDQKLQIMEQIMMMFNPSLEIQTTDNYVDWTSLSVVELTDITFTSRQIPQGVDSEIDIGTLEFETPIWISAPSKVKRLGVIHDIIMNIHDNDYTFETQQTTTIGGFNVFVYNENGNYYAELLDPSSVVEALPDIGDALWKKHGTDLNWRVLLDQFTNFKAGSSQIFLTQPNGNEVVGTVALNPINELRLSITFDKDTYNTNTVIEGPARNQANWGTVDAIVNPETYNPGSPVVGWRVLLLNDIPNDASAWANFTATANSIIEFDGTIWEALALPEGIVYTTNIRTGVQYKYEDGEWTRAFEGEYSKGSWRLVV